MKRSRMAVAAAAAAGLGLAGLRAARGAEPAPLPDPPAAMAEVAQREQDVAFFQARIARDPYSAADRNRLAALYLQRARETGDYEDFRRAERSARASVQLRAARNPGGLMLLASSLLAQHRFAEARAAAERLVAMDAEKASHRALLAEIQMELGDYAAAGATFGSLEGDRHNLAVAPRLARWAEIRGRTGEARRLLHAARDQAVRRTDLPREQVAWFHLRVGDLELRNGRLREAERALRAGLAVEPADHRLYAALARVEAARGEWRRVLECVARAGDRADLATLALAGDAHAALGDPAEAERWYARLEAQAAANPEPFARQWTQFRVEHGRERAATLAILEREARERPDVLGLDLLAWARYLDGRPEAAVEPIRQAMRMGTQDATLLYHAGLIGRATGDPGWTDPLRRALEINPRLPWAEDARSLLRDAPEGRF